MKKNIYEYICNHDYVSTHEIAKALNAEEIQVLHYVNELCRDSYIKMNPIVPLSPSNDNSNYYSATSKKYIEN